MSQQQAYFPLVSGGKLPAIQAWQEVQPGQFPPVGNHGLVLTPADLVIDADPRNYPDGRDVLKEFLEVFKLPPTRLVKTPNGGVHLYYKKPPHLAYKKTQKAYPGIDFLSAGAYTVQPGSCTDKGTYLLVSDQEAADLSQCANGRALLNALERRAEAQTGPAQEVSLLEAARFKAECEAALPAIEGEGGDKTTYTLACRGRDLGLPDTVVYQYMRDHWNPRCQPAWEEKDLWTKVQNAYKYAKNSLGSASAEARLLECADTSNVLRIDTYQRELVVKGLHQEFLELDKRGAIKHTAGNITYILRNDPAWRGRVRFNEYMGALEFVSRPDWRAHQLNCGLELTKRDLACMRVWFSSAAHIKLEVTEEALRSALQAAAEPYHPVRDYLSSLKWDGVPRLDTMLVDTAGALDSPYTRTISACVMIAAVKRIFEPGCKHDYVLVLEGRQGTGKSQWIGALGGDWYSASELVRGDKDTYQNLRGRWFVELPEINATFKKADFAWLKGIISSPVDVYRASYALTATAVPRESVFIGSINPTANREYLRDDENRRYWPVVTGKFDLERLRRDRDQYFAEAVARYKAGEASWITSQEVAELAAAEQEIRRERDPWCDLLQNWSDATVATKAQDVYALLGMSVGETSGSVRSRLYNVLTDLGFVYVGTGNRGRWIKKDWVGLL